MGFVIGVVPLIAFAYSANNQKRLTEGISCVIGIALWLGVRQKSLVEASMNE